MVALQSSIEDFKDYASCNRGFSLERKAFNTQAELDAYLMGLLDGNSMDSYRTLSISEEQQLKDYIDE